MFTLLDTQERLLEILAENDIEMQECAVCGWLDYASNFVSCHTGSKRQVCLFDDACGCEDDCLIDPRTSDDSEEDEIHSVDKGLELVAKAKTGIYPTMGATSMEPKVKKAKVALDEESQ